MMRWVALAGDAERAEETMRLAREALAVAGGRGGPSPGLLLEVGGAEKEGSGGSNGVGGGGGNRGERSSEGIDGSSSSSNSSSFEIEDGTGGWGLKEKAAARRRKGAAAAASSSAGAAADADSPDIVLSKLFVETLFQSWWQDSRINNKGSKKAIPSSSSEKEKKLAAALEAWRELLLSSPLPLPQPSSPSSSQSPAAAADRGNVSPLPSYFSLDLHSFNHWSAQLALLEALKRLLPLLPPQSSQEAAAEDGNEDFWPSNPSGEPFHSSSSSSFPSLLVITGRGNRSKDRGAPPVRRAALSLLHRLGCPAALAEGNDGCVVVRGAALADLFARERARGRGFEVGEHAADLVGLDFHREISLANRL